MTANGVSWLEKCLRSVASAVGWVDPELDADQWVTLLEKCTVGPRDWTGGGWRVEWKAGKETL